MLIRNFNYTWKKSRFFNINIRSKWKCVAICICFMVCIYIQNFFDVLIRRKAKAQEKNMSCERALNFKQWKSFSEIYKRIRVWLLLIYKFTENNCCLQRFSYLPRQSKSPDLKITCRIKPKLFLWTKYPEKKTYFLQNISYLSLRVQLLISK